MPINNELTKLKERINKFFDVDIDSPFRGIQSIYARSTYYKLCKTLDYSLTTNKIGKSVNRDHSTVIHNLQKFDDRYEYDKTYQMMHDNFLSKYPEYLDSKFYTQSHKEIKKLINDTTDFLITLTDDKRKRFIDELNALKESFKEDVEIQEEQ
jgi:hypothetical protein